MCSERYFIKFVVLAILLVVKKRNLWSGVLDVLKIRVVMWQNYVKATVQTQ